MNSSIPNLCLLKFNALHFEVQLFQQYLGATFIRMKHDRIQWIKANRKKLADKYNGVIKFLKELVKKKCCCVKVVLPFSFPGSIRYYTGHFEDYTRLGSSSWIIRFLHHDDFVMHMP